MSRPQRRRLRLQRSAVRSSCALTADLKSRVPFLQDSQSQSTCDSQPHLPSNDVCNRLFMLEVLIAEIHWAQVGVWRSGAMESTQGEYKEPDTNSYNAAINACEKASEWTRLLDLWSTMQRDGVKPNTNSYNAAINACEKASEWTSLLDLRSSMQHDGMEPNTNSDLLSNLQREDMEPNTNSYSAATSTCKMTVNANLLHLDPMQSLHFSHKEWTDTSGVTTKTLRLSSLSACPVAYKVKTTAPKSYFGTALLWSHQPEHQHRDPGHIESGSICKATYRP